MCRRYIVGMENTEPAETRSWQVLHISASVFGRRLTGGSKELIMGDRLRKRTPETIIIDGIYARANCFHVERYCVSLQRPLFTAGRLSKLTMTERCWITDKSWSAYRILRNSCINYCCNIPQAFRRLPRAIFTENRKRHGKSPSVKSTSVYSNRFIFTSRQLSTWRQLNA